LPFILFPSFVTRRRNVPARDRRVKRLSLTPAGNAVLAKAYVLWQEFHGAIEAEMASPSADAMRNGLIRMVRKLERGNAG
jgi:DNA-binding MarR family transcriptional regulator